MQKKYLLGFDKKVNQIVNSQDFERSLNEFLSFVGHQIFLELDNVDGDPDTSSFDVGNYTFKYTNELKFFGIYVYLGEDNHREKGLGFAQVFLKEDVAELLFRANLDLSEDVEACVYSKQNSYEIGELYDYIFELRQSHGYLEDIDSEDFIIEDEHKFSFTPQNFHISYDLESKKILIQTTYEYQTLANFQIR